MLIEILYGQVSSKG